jgi:PAS domain S-box-containing protein
MIETVKKIQELIDQNKTLERRNEELRNIIGINLANQKNSLFTCSADIIDKQDIESLVFKFYQLYKLPAALKGPDNSLLFSIGWNKLFSNSTTLHQYLNDINEFILDQKREDPSVKYMLYKKPEGFYALLFPIEINNGIQATLIFNQFFINSQTPDYDSIKNFAGKYKIEERLLLNEITGFKVFTPMEFPYIINLGTLLTEMINFIGNKNESIKRLYKQQTDKESILNSLLKKIQEQDILIKNLLKSITAHQKDLSDNTILKTTLQKETQKITRKLEKTETILNSVLTSSPLGICFIKKDIITFSNDQMYRLNGYTTKELLGRPISILLTDNSLWVNSKEKIEKEAQKEHIFFVTNLKHKNEGQKEVTCFLSCTDPGNVSEGFTLSIMDNAEFNTLKSEKVKLNWQNKTILIVEDEELNYFYLKSILKPTQVNILWASNGLLATEIMSEENSVNLILMDIKMPVMNGIEATKIIKTIKPEIPIIAQTAFVQDNTKDEIFAAGCDEFLAKPINTKYFMSVLEKYLS